MNRPQRVVLIAYGVLLAYCCIWVPRHVKSIRERERRSGYGWLWAGPSSTEVLAGYGQYHTPDLPIIGLRLLAVTAIAGAAFGAAAWKQN
jgi:hypothetical protein